MPPRPSSAGMQSIRRELQRRRPKPLAPKSSAAMKPSAPPPPHPPCEGARYASREPPREEIPSSVASQPRCRAGTDAPRPRPHAPPHPTPPSRSAASLVRSPRRPTPSADAAHLRPGTAVGVRTRTTTLKTGEVLVLWLRATIVSTTTHGGCEVIYDGNWPPSDPYGTVRVPLRHVRLINPSPTTPPPPPPSCAAVPAAQKKETQPAPRPTRAGKSLRLIRRSLLPEMERSDLPGYY